MPATGIAASPSGRNELTRKTPVIEAFRLQGGDIVLSALARLSEQAPFYIFTAFIF